MVNKTGTSAGPLLEIHQSWWAMRNIGDKKGEWSFEKKMDNIKMAGFHGVLGRLPLPEEAAAWRSKLDECQFRFGIEAFISDERDIEPYLSKAADFGVDYINAQVGSSFLTGQDAISLLDGLVEKAEQYGIPLFVETHRGRITQDLIRTIEYVNEIENLRLTIDLSHYVLAGEINRQVESFDPYFERLLRRTASIHGRISNGQQIQVDISSLDDHPMTAHFRRWWTNGMTYWRRSAKSGDFFPFVCELGPPDYAITTDVREQNARAEISDRWTSSLSLKRLAEQIWETMTN
jgi:sugar phosphate isomerase/epimerase